VANAECATWRGLMSFPQHISDPLSWGTRSARFAFRTRPLAPRSRGKHGEMVEPTSGLEPLTCSLRDPEDPEE
jgi:hypothetical protein